MKTTRGGSTAVGAVGVPAAILVASLLVPLRDDFGNANMALVLVIVVVVAASLGGRTAGAMTSFSAAASYNFFLTKPYGTLRVTDRNDIVTIGLLLVLGLIVGELAELRARSEQTSRVAGAGSRRLEKLVALSAVGADIDVVWPAVRDAVAAELGLQRCTFVPGGGSTGVPRIERDGRVILGEKRYTGSGFALPGPQIEIPVVFADRVLGQIVCEPVGSNAVSRDQRRVAVAMADQLAVVVNRTDHLTPLS